MAEASGETKPVPKQESTVVTLVVKDQFASEVQFRVKIHTKFEKVFKAYCEKKGLTNPRELKFLFDGNRLMPHQTPAEYEMEDDDVIDCMIEQQGGCS